MVGVARLELAASWSRTMRATICATPRCSFFIIMITHTVVKYQFSFLQRNMRNLSILVFGRNVSFCYFHLDSIPESHYNKTTAVSPVLQTLLTTSLETVHCCQSPFFFLSMLRKYKNAATNVAAFLWQAAPIKISAVFLVFSMVSAFWGKVFGACCFILLVAAVQPKKILWDLWNFVRSARFCQRSPL